MLCADLKLLHLLYTETVAFLTAVRSRIEFSAVRKERGNRVGVEMVIMRVRGADVIEFHVGCADKLRHKTLESEISLAAVGKVEDQRQEAHRREP